ncbi:MAG: hypothetical protein ACRDGR_09410 [bacterium]
MPGSLVRRLEYVDRRWLFLAMAVAIVVPLIVSMPLPLYVSAMVQDLYDAIEALPDRSIVLISADYDPTAKPELEPFHVALLHHLAGKKIRMVMISLWPAAPPLTDKVVAEVGLVEKYGYEKGVDFVHLGYKDGRQIVMEAMGTSIRNTFPLDRDGNPVESNPLMQQVDKYSDVAMLINISGGFPGVKEYVQVVQSRYGIKLVGACTAVSGPDYVPYYQATPKQLVGLAAGMKGTAEYEKLVGRPGSAMAGMAAQSSSHLLLILFIVFGNVMFFLARRENR